MTELLFVITIIIAFCATVMAYLLGATHGMSVNRKYVPKPVTDAIDTVKTAVSGEPKEQVEESIVWDYNAMLQSVTDARMRGEK